MFQIVHAEFDGSVFVPTEKVNLPAGTVVNLSVTVENDGKGHVIKGKAPEPMTDEDLVEWEEIRRELEANPPEHPTLEECMRKLRGPSWS